MTDLVWRKEPPDQPGWWWVRRGKDDVEHVCVAAVPGHGLHVVVHEDGRAWIARPLKDVQQDLSVADGAEWAGPMEEPKEAR